MITTAAALGSIAAGILLGLSCKRETRSFEVPAPAASAPLPPSVTDLYAGGTPPPTTMTATEAQGISYQDNAYALSEGKRLFSSYNCTGCHAHGGGGMGPPLMDDKWIYGADPAQIHATILQGRPNGMPSFRGRIPDYQAWQLAAYVRSLSGLVAKDAAPARDDHMRFKQPENSVPTTIPRSTGTPKSSEMPS
jgi:cytochrome c oxidase cbb3-type subunit 3